MKQAVSYLEQIIVYHDFCEDVRKVIDEFKDRNPGADDLEIMAMLETKECAIMRDHMRFYISVIFQVLELQVDSDEMRYASAKKILDRANANMDRVTASINGEVSI